MFLFRRGSLVTGFVAGVALGMALVGSWTSIAHGGSLDPAAAPASTMKSLADLVPSWHRVLSDAGDDACNTERFTCVMGGAAVLDNETGLVWEQTPSASTLTWNDALFFCRDLDKGGRMGWRLPTVDELATLVDRSASTAVKISLNQPFSGLTAVDYWTLSPGSDGGAAFPAVVDFSDGHIAQDGGGNSHRYWCVRAPHEEL